MFLLACKCNQNAIDYMYSKGNTFELINVSMQQQEPFSQNLRSILPCNIVMMFLGATCYDFSHLAKTIKILGNNTSCDRYNNLIALN